VIEERDLTISEELVRARNSSFGIRLFIGADASFFLAFVFAYLYLKTIDTPDLWMGASQGGSTALGAVGAVALIGGTAAAWFGLRGLREGAPQRWRLGARLAVLFGLIALAMIIWQLVTIGYNPSGYDSVLIGWDAALGLHLLVVTLLMTGSSLEQRVVESPSALDIASVSALTWLWGFLAAVGLLGFVLLGVIR
jgi:heme/copper-type cytochrome/quinol oxidase subunit 3